MQIHRILVYCDLRINHVQRIREIEFRNDLFVNNVERLSYFNVFVYWVAVFDSQYIYLLQDDT